MPGLLVIFYICLMVGVAGTPFGRRDRCICIDGRSSWLFLCCYFLPRCLFYAYCMPGQLVIFYICLMVGVAGTPFGSKKQLYLH
uniref:Uncharacterized protein n=1 Tax=Nelumbo nucifera TaxID=4432 RepID=A0A822YL46_NELNU|nr:TPA_asm: hypothetical protein HUJ06_010487 [Nelumbo nucifera]